MQAVILRTVIQMNESQQFCPSKIEPILKRKVQKSVYKIKAWIPVFKILKFRQAIVVQLQSEDGHLLPYSRMCCNLNWSMGKTNALYSQPELSVMQFAIQMLKAHLHC